MYFLKCDKCGYFNEVKTDYLIFCSSCNKKIASNYTDWQVRNPDQKNDDFKRLICVSEDEVKKNIVKEKPNKPKGLKYWISFSVAFAVFYAIGHFGGEAIINYFKNPELDRAMMQMAGELNKSCPVMIDSETRLDNTTSLPNNVFQYNYSLINLDKDSVNIEEAKTYLESTIATTVRTNPDMKYFRDNKTTINYSYKDRSGVFLFKISITPDKYK